MNKNPVHFNIAAQGITIKRLVPPMRRLRVKRKERLLSSQLSIASMKRQARQISAKEEEEEESGQSCRQELGGRNHQDDSLIRVRISDNPLDLPQYDHNLQRN